MKWPPPLRMRFSQRSACPMGRRAGNDHASSAAAPLEEANRARVVRRWRQALILANLFLIGIESCNF